MRGFGPACPAGLDTLLRLKEIDLSNRQLTLREGTRCTWADHAKNRMSIIQMTHLRVGECKLCMRTILGQNLPMLAAYARPCHDDSRVALVTSTDHSAAQGTSIEHAENFKRHMHGQSGCIWVLHAHSDNFLPGSLLILMRHRVSTKFRRPWFPSLLKCSSRCG